VVLHVCHAVLCGSLCALFPFSIDATTASRSTQTPLPLSRSTVLESSRLDRSLQLTTVGTRPSSACQRLRVATRHSTSPPLHRNASLAWRVDVLPRHTLHHPSSERPEHPRVRGEGTSLTTGRWARGVCHPKGHAHTCHVHHA